MTMDGEKMEDKGQRLNITEVWQKKEKTFLERVTRLSKLSFCLLVVFLVKKDLDELEVE